MFCPKCGNQVPEGNSFCGKCGATVEAPKPVENQFTEIVYNAESDAFTPVTPVPTPAPASTETKADDVIATAAAVHGVAPSQVQPAQKKKKNNTKTIIIICVCALLIIGIAVAGLIWFLNSDNNKPSGKKNKKDNEVIDLTNTTAQDDTTTEITTGEPTTEELTTEPTEELDSSLFGIWQTVEEREATIGTDKIKLKTYIALGFNDDGKFVMLVNEDATVKAWLLAYYTYFEEEAGLTADQVNAEYEASNGITFEAAIQDTVSKLANESRREGTWRTKNGSLCLVISSDNSEIDGTEVEDFYSVVEKEKLVFNGYTYDFAMNLDGTIPE
jgi:hypothetical protein